MEEYKGEGLRGPARVIGGVEILRAAKEVLSEFRGGGHHGGGSGCSGNHRGYRSCSGCCRFRLRRGERGSPGGERAAEGRAGIGQRGEGAGRFPLTNYLKPYGDEIADARVREAKLQAEFNGYKEVVDLRIRLAEQEAKCCCEKANARIDCLETRLDAITKTVVPSAAVEKAA